MAPFKIMIIEDDRMIQDELKLLLSSNGYETETVQDFKSIIKEAEVFSPHLILLDINLPYEDGFKICAKIRCSSDVPIIFVTSRDTDMDELNSIMLGGDAFIKKPYNISILLAKTASLLKRAYKQPASGYPEYKGAVLHPETSTLLYDNKQVDLTKNEMKILYYLFQHSGRICPRGDIIEFLWDNQLYIDDNTLSVNITRIREKLLTAGLDNFIKTKHRQGYII